MLNIKNTNQTELFDPWGHLGKKVRRRLYSSWADLFRAHVLPRLPVREFSKFFDANCGRPSKELHIGLGVLLLQQMHDVTDEETVDSLAFNMQWHYALNISDNGDTNTYICVKTLFNIREAVIESGLDARMFDCVRDELLQVFNVNTDKQRLDSKHIKSNMCKLGRVGIFVRTIRKFLTNIKKSHNNLFKKINRDITDRYLTEKGVNCFSMVKPSKVDLTLDMLSKDLLGLAELFRDEDVVNDMHAFKLVKRVLNEHCHVTTQDDKTEIEMKKPKEIPSDSLQNPSDPDASYSGHKGQGYQVQVMETFQEDKKETTPNIITHVEVEPAHNSDANALTPALEKTCEAGILPEEIQADSLYGSDENQQNALKTGTELVAPVMGKKNGGKMSLADFEVSEKAGVISCPEGQKPESVKTNEKGFSAFFDSELCANCPKNKECPAKKGAKAWYVRYKKKDLRLALRRQYEQTDEFKERYRMRAGVEATMSEYDRKTGVGRLRVRGLKAVRLCAVLKAAGINVFRAVAAKAAQVREKQAENRMETPLSRIFFVFKEQIGTFFGKIGRIWGRRLISATI